MTERELDTLIFGVGLVTFLMVIVGAAVYTIVA